METERAPILSILNGKTGFSTDGFPIIEEDSFKSFLHEVPHLMIDGLAVLDFLAKFATNTPSQERAKKVLETLIFTAGVTAPTDLWLLKHLLTAYHRLGILERFVTAPFSIDDIEKAFGINPEILKLDLNFLANRGLFVRNEDMFQIRSQPRCDDHWSLTSPYIERIPIDILDILTRFLKASSSAAFQPLELVFRLPNNLPKNYGAHPGWFPGRRHIEIGSRLVPLILGFKTAGIFEGIAPGIKMPWPHPQARELFAPLLHVAGLLRDDDEISPLGYRVFLRGSGPFGIIHAYHTYLSVHQAKLQNLPVKSWVSRGANVSASKDANALTFARAHDGLDRYCEDSGFNYTVFIEHAVGTGEATRQRFGRSKDKALHYFGADLEDAAIEAALKNQAEGLLPANMKFLSSADIGKPGLVIDFVKSFELDTKNAVMMVGNGFHEVRNQTDDQMIAIFREYANAGILLIFTEESALTDSDLLATGFNTYHAGFRYVHELSGQGLRPANERTSKGNEDKTRLSWTSCANRGGYKVLSEYGHSTRTIFPYCPKDGYNPAISVTYFCVPNI